MNQPANKTLLLVEDDIITAQTEKTMLEALGYKIILAENGERAIDTFKKNNIDLVLMDVDLGEGIDGTQAAEAILKERNVPVVFLSSHTEPEVVEKTEKITSYGYVVKNTGITVLDASIKMAFKLFEARTKEKEINDALAHSHRLMNYIIEHDRSAIAVHDKDLKYIYVSRRYLQEYKVSEQEVIGRHHYEVFPDLPQKWREVHSKALAGEILSAENDPYIRRDGSTDWTRWECRPWHEADGSIGGIIIYTEIINDRKRAEEAMIESETRYKYISDATSDFVFSCAESAEGAYAIDWMAGAVERITGYTLEELRAKGCWRSLVHPEDAALFDENIINIAEGTSGSCTLRITTKSGVIKWIAVNTKHIPSKNAAAPHRIFGGCTDITERKLAEEKLELLLEEKEMMLKEVHHRIRNNLNAIDGLISLQMDALSEPSAAEVLNDTRSRMLSMMLIYDKLYRSENFMEISFRQYLAPLVDGIIAIFPSRALIKTEKIIDDFIIDSKRLSYIGIIVNECLTNILKYAFTGRDKGSIRITAENKENKVTITVQDDGVGIPDAIYSDGSGGFGFKLIEMMARQLRGAARFERGSGTRFILQFSLQSL